MEIQNDIEFNDDRFDPEKYWSQREVKTWVVTLYHSVRRGRRIDRNCEYTTKYVTAKTKEGAVRTAKYFNFSKRKITGVSVRLATPEDLNCVPANSFLLT